MSQLKKFQSWLAAFQKANDSFPDEKAIKFKIKELLKEEIVQSKSKDVKIYFRESEWSDYNALRMELGKSAKFVRDYAGVDLRAYIESALAWSESGRKSTELGWLLTLKNWMRRAKQEKRLIMKPKANVQDAFNNQ